MKMLIVDNIITDDEVQQLRNYFVVHNHEKFLNWQDGDKIIDHRLTIPPSASEFSIINRVVATHFSNPIQVWSAYQQQTNPHNIHIDDFGCDTPYFRYTYIIAMDTAPEFKAVIWKETCQDNAELSKFYAEWGEQVQHKTKVSTISETEDLEHTIDLGQNIYIADYLTLDGVFTYKAGSCCFFDATQLHCTNNWRKYSQFSNRQLLQIHVLNKEKIHC